MVDLPDDRQAIENKWIFKKKTGADGNITVYKARLVAKGFRQVQGVDYDETLSSVMMLDHDEPTNYEEAMVSPDSAKWLEAMKCEMGSMYENKVWTLVDLPDDRQAIENKWIFNRKTDADSSVTI